MALTCPMGLGVFNPCPFGWQWSLELSLIVTRRQAILFNFLDRKNGTRNFSFFETGTKNFLATDAKLSSYLRQRGQSAPGFRQESGPIGHLIEQIVFEFIGDGDVIARRLGLIDLIQGREEATGGFHDVASHGRGTGQLFHAPGGVVQAFQYELNVIQKRGQIVVGGHLVADSKLPAERLGLGDELADQFGGIARACDPARRDRLAAPSAGHAPVPPGNASNSYCRGDASGIAHERCRRSCQQALPG